MVPCNKFEERVEDGIFLILSILGLIVALTVAIPFWLIGFIADKICKAFGTEL